VKIRAAVAASLSLGLVVTGAANAAVAKPKPKVKPVCNLVTDATGDTFAARSQDTAGKYGPQEDSLDLKSIDLASDAKTVTGVIRVVKLSAVPQTSPYGTSYEMEWLIPGTDNHMYLAAATSVKDGTTFTAGFRDATSNVGTKLADAKGVFDLAKNEIRISTPVSTFGGQGRGMKPGTKITFGDLDQTASRNGVAVSVFADVTTSGVVYTTGAPSCVVPGK
jgi:hypothetical protein